MHSRVQISGLRVAAGRLVLLDRGAGVITEDPVEAVGIETRQDKAALHLHPLTAAQ